MLEFCLKLNIRCVSAYAFSIENFKRPVEEVDALMKLAEEKLLELCQHGWSWSSPNLKPGSHIVVGIFWKSMVFDWTWLVTLNSYLNICKKRHGKLRIWRGIIISRSALYSRLSISNDSMASRYIFNLCMPYTSRDEITTAVEACVTDFVANGSIERYAYNFFSSVRILLFYSLYKSHHGEGHWWSPYDIAERKSTPWHTRSNKWRQPFEWFFAVAGEVNLTSVLYQPIDFLSVVSAAKRHNCSLYPLTGLILVSLISFLSSWIINGKYGAVAYLFKHCSAIIWYIIISP